MQGNEQPFDRRTVLAFVLMGIVWLGWLAVQPAPAPVEDTVATETADTTTATQPSRADRGEVVGSTPNIPDTETLTVEPSQSTDWADLADSAVGTPIEVSTPLFEATIDRVGGDILSWQLREYDKVDGSPVNLVADRTMDARRQYAHALRVLLEDRSFDLARVRFETSTSRIVLAGDDGPTDLVLRASRLNGGAVEIVYHFFPDRYGFDVDVRITPGSGESLPVAWEVGWPGGISSTEPDSVSERREFRAVARVGDEVHKIGYDKAVKGDGSGGRRAYEGTVSWAGVESLYFLSAVVASDMRLGTVKLDGDPAVRVQAFDADLALVGREPATVQYSVYMGPVDYDILAKYDGEPWNAKLTSLVDLGPSVFRWVAELTLGGLRLLYQVVPNWGWTIILFSVLTKLLFWPLTKSSVTSMRRMQEMQPKMKKLQEKYKDEPQRQSQEMMKLYKEHGVNPLNMGGCLPLLVQMPVFWALFTILRKSIDLRQAEFALWIDDLSQPDRLFDLPFSVPLLGWDHVSVLPILMSVGMYLQTKFQQTPVSSQSENPLAQQMRMMTTLMPLMMFFFFYNSPSGLVLYWLVNTVLSAYQTWRISRTMPSQPATSGS